MKNRTAKTSRISAARILNGVILIALALLTLYPFWYVVCVAFSDQQALVGRSLIFRPYGFNFDSLVYVMTSRDFTSIFSNTVFVVVIGTLLSMICTIGIAYALARKVKGHRFWNFFIFVTLVFEGGMIPTYLVVRDTGLLNSVWALILPRLCSPYYIMLLRNSFESVPASLDESANLDGAGVIKTLIYIILPVSLPGLTTIALFYGVLYWNNFMDGVLYLTDRTKWTMQVLLREILITVQPDQMGGAGGDTSSLTTTEAVKMATVLVTVLPVLVIYPFIQKYFVSGIMVGAVKG